MWGRKSPIEEYLDKHPDSTLREYNEYVKEEERKRHQEKVDSDNRHKALLKSYIEKCFKIDFNGMSTMFSDLHPTQQIHEVVESKRMPIQFILIHLRYVWN